MGATFAECRSKANVQMTFTVMFGPIQEGSAHFVQQFVTMDETWVHLYTTPETKQQSMQWVEAGG